MRRYIGRYLMKASVVGIDELWQSTYVEKWRQSFSYPYT